MEIAKGFFGPDVETAFIGITGESSTIVSAVGTKKKSAAKTQRLMEEGPLWAAAAIQRGPSTAAILNSSTSQNPISRRNCDLTSETGGVGELNFALVKMK